VEKKGNSIFQKRIGEEETCRRDMQKRHAEETCRIIK